jgi:hypothetical protein
MTGLAEKWIRKLIRQELVDFLPSVLVSLEKDARYILVLPEDLNKDDLREALNVFNDDVNIMVVQAGGVKIIQLSDGG